jgi:hypothetical protein
MALALSEISPESLEKFSKRLPTRIEDALDLPVVREVISVAGQTNVQAYIHFELIKLSNLVSVGGNLNHQQAVFIAQELINLFPNETLADFKLCFQRGAIGQYGEIFRLDGIVIRGWMEKYLEEKYEVKVRELYKERDEMYKPAPRTLTEEIQDQKTKDRLQQWKETILKASEDMKIPDLPENIVKETGKENYRPPAKTGGEAWFNVRGIEILASSQEEAEKRAAIALKHGILKEDNTPL